MRPANCWQSATYGVLTLTAHHDKAWDLIEADARDQFERLLKDLKRAHRNETRDAQDTKKIEEKR